MDFMNSLLSEVFHCTLHQGDALNTLVPEHDTVPCFNGVTIITCLKAVSSFFPEKSKKKK